MAFGSLLTGVTGLRANQQSLEVIGNNLANASTPAYKSQRTRFADLFYQTVVPPTPSTTVVGGTNPIQIGFGGKVSSVDSILNQGTLEPTGRDLDAGIQGEGFFQLGDANGRVFYTRAGSFTVDSAGFLRDPSTGFNVLRFGTVGDFDATTNPKGIQVPGDNKIRVPFGSNTPGEATENVTLRGNLDAEAVAGTPGGTTTTAIEVFDSQGRGHVLTVKFTKDDTDPNTWALDFTMPGATVTPATDDVTFDTFGALDSPETIDLTITFADPDVDVEDLEVTLNLGSQGGFDGLTQFGGASSAAAAVLQDGSASGNLSTLSFGKDGTIQGVFTNGDVIELGVLAIATFANPAGLNREGNNLFSVSSQSGEALVGPGLSGGRGAVQQGVLEQSNVDVALEFTRLIIAQRGFQVNTRTITVSDQMLQELANIIR